MKLLFGLATTLAIACSTDRLRQRDLPPADSAAVRVALDSLPRLQDDTSTFDFVEHAGDTTIVWLKPKHARGTDWPHHVVWVVPGLRITRAEFRVGGD